ncbi:hypothetical protein [Castellaniella sp.]|uniref:hypothetical protein n=1 Tax=Castellaniella sp. TaxID=1955812 RepID=UPI003216C9F7
MPPEAETDVVVEYALSVFSAAHLVRRYVVGAKASPLPLSEADVTAVAKAHGLHMDRELLDRCVLSVDREWMAAV